MPVKSATLVVFLLLTAVSLAAPAPTPSAAPKKISRQSSAASLLGTKPEEGPEFVAKLQDMRNRTEESIKLMRQQITESQSAPFLPDLYMQLADLLVQKANVLYYLQMEKRKTVSLDEHEKALSPVIFAQKEAIQVYKRVLKDFPKFGNRKRATLRLAVALRSIDEIPEFLNVAKTVPVQFPGTEEAMMARILLGQHHFQEREFAEARSYLIPITQVEFPYERNLARYRLGLIDLGEDKFRDALTRFEEVIREKELAERENPYEISLKSRQVKNDLRREALIDSIRAYTHVFEKDGDPVGYYSKIAPTEVLFQEVIEKLAVRYIGLKKYEQAVALLRTMSERIADPQKVCAIYRDVLMLIPPKDRISIPVSEMQFVLERYNQWMNYYALSVPLAKDAQVFFEKNVRELATTSHDLAKALKTKNDVEKKRKLLIRARDFYLLYVGFFEKSPDVVKMATNLADVYFALGDFYESGGYYLRVFDGEFGPSKTQSKALIENAIFCLQKPDERGYYENIRRRGLLIRAIESYSTRYPEYRNKPDLQFTSIKAQYEQSLFPATLEVLQAFMMKHKHAPEALKAGALLLDYYTTRGDFSGLEKIARAILAMKLPSREFNGRVAGIQKQAKTRAIQDQLRTAGNYDDFAQGKSYLAVALKSENSALANEALGQALARSKAEKDIGTFLEVGRVMSSQEKDPKKRYAIIHSIAREQFRVGRFYDGIKTLQGASVDSVISGSDRKQSLDEALSVALMLRDWNLVTKLSAESMSEETRKRLRDQTVDLLDSGVLPPPAMVSLTLQGANAEILYSAYRARASVDAATREAILKAVRSSCGGSERQPACLWERLGGIDQKAQEFMQKLATAPPTMEGLQKSAQIFQEATEYLKGFEGKGDAIWEGALAARNYRVFQLFAEQLSKASLANPELKAVLEPKSREALTSARVYLARCKSVPTTSAFCTGTAGPSASDLFGRVKTVQPPAAPGKDPESESQEILRKKLFGGKEESLHAFELAKDFFRDGQFHHAAALAGIGTNSYSDRAEEFKTILGCSVIQLGLVGEGRYYLKNSVEVEGMRSKCLAQASAKKGGSP